MLMCMISLVILKYEEKKSIYYKTEMVKVKNEILWRV